MSNIPEPEVVLKNLAYLLPTIYSALQDGTYKAKEYCDQYETAGRIDPFLAPNLVRYHTIKLLQKQGHLIDEELNLDNVPNNGICLSYRNYKIRILKASNGDLPVPGHSKSRQHFYHQIPFKFMDEEDSGVTMLNLVLLWDVATQYNLSEVCLVCPKSGGVKRETVEAHWSYPIPLAVLMGEPFEDLVPAAQAVEDLPISLKRHDKNVTEGKVD